MEAAGGHRLLCCLQDYGKVPTYMQKRAAEERSRLEAYCLQLQEEKEEQIKRRLQKQQDALLVPTHTHPAMLLPHTGVPV